MTLTRLPLEANDSLVIAAALRDDAGGPIPITSGDLTVRGATTSSPVILSVAADLAQAAEGIALFAIPPNALGIPGPCYSAVVVRQGTALQQTGAFVIDVIEHA